MLAIVRDPIFAMSSLSPFPRGHLIEFRLEPGKPVSLVTMTFKFHII